MSKLALVRRKIIGWNLTHRDSAVTSWTLFLFLSRACWSNSTSAFYFLATGQGLSLTTCTLTIWHNTGQPRGCARFVLKCAVRLTLFTQSESPQWSFTSSLNASSPRAPEDCISQMLTNRNALYFRVYYYSRNANSKWWCVLGIYLLLIDVQQLLFLPCFFW